VINVEAFCRAKWDWLVGGAGFAAQCRMLPSKANFALLRLCQLIREVTVAQTHCRRRILCRVRVLPRIAAPYEILAKLLEKLVQGDWLGSECLLVKDVGISN
jgi:hypothetical protein